MTFDVGVGCVDITPPQTSIHRGQVWLWGYASRTTPCTGVLDPLEARALVVRDDADATAIFVTLDVGALAPASTERICTRIADSSGVSSEYICVNVSHTHTAPAFVSIPT